MRGLAALFSEAKLENGAMLMSAFEPKLPSSA
jgi:hypothetical protein